MVDVNYTRERKKLLEKRLDPVRTRAWQENLLLQYKIVPLVKSGPLPKKDPADPHEEVIEGQTAFLGQGKYGYVMRAVYKGKEVAVKVTDEKAESDNWEAIGRIIDSAPADIAKHFPKIYDIITDDNYEKTYIMVVMELLAPLSSSKSIDLKDKLFHQEQGGSGKTKQDLPLSMQTTKRITKGKEADIAQLIKDPNTLFAAFKSVVESIERADSITLPSSIKQGLFKHILDFKPLSAGSQSVFDFPIYVTSAFNTVIEALSPTEKEKLFPELSDLSAVLALGHRIGNDMIVYLRDMIQGGAFPAGASIGDDKRDVYRQIPETQSLLKALEYLESYGVDWHDVHSGNIMIRPSTGDLVVVDVGLYEQN